MRDKRERVRLEKRLQEAKEEVKRREEAAASLERQLAQMDQEEAGRILKKYHLTPGELDEILVKQEKEGKKLIEIERSLKGNETI